MKVDTFACDNCQKQKESTNHWWQVWPGRDRQIVIAPFNEGTAMPNKQDACGQQCLVAMLERFLATGSFARTAAGKVAE